MTVRSAITQAKNDRFLQVFWLEKGESLQYEFQVKMFVSAVALYLSYESSFSNGAFFQRVATAGCNIAGEMESEK